MNKRLITNGKTPTLSVAAILACCMLLCSCNSGTSKTGRNSSSGEKQEGAEITTEATAATTSAADTTSATSTYATQWDAYPDPTVVYIPDSTPYQKVTLDGVKEHHFIAEDYCYIESDKFFIFLDKDIELPGDFVVNVEAIINEIEHQLGISANPDSYNYSPLCDNSVYYGGFNPWKGWSAGKKIPIYLMVDRESEGWISGAYSDDTILVIYECFSDDLWNSVPEYRDNPWRRMNCMDYGTITHELTHTITGRNCDLTDILTEGIAQHMAVTVIDALAADYPSIGEYKACTEPYDYGVPEAVNADNAESIFIEDYNQLSQFDRGPQYDYGKYLFKFLNEEYGSDYFTLLCSHISMNGLHYSYGNYDKSSTTGYATALKSIFGDDIFTKFGNWCVTNGYLQ